MPWGSAFGEFILFVIYIICYPLVDCLVAPATCGAIADCLSILVALSLSCSRLAIALPSPRRRLAPPSSQDAKVDLKPLIVSVIPIYSLSETMFLFYFLVFILINKLITFSAS